VTATAAPPRERGALRDGIPPGPNLPPALSTARWMVRPTAYMEECRRRYGDVFSFPIVREGRWVLVADPDDVKRVFQASPEALRAGEANAVLGPIVGSRSLLLLDGSRHLEERRIMLPAFHGERMQSYASIMREAAEAEAARWPRGEAFPVWPATQAITLEVIMRAVFGVEGSERLDPLRAALRELLDWAGERSRLFLLAFIGSKRMHRVSAFARATEAVSELLLEEIRRHRADPRLDEREDILSLLLQARYEDGSAMGDDELRDELVTLLVAGHETTATSLAWTFERLVHHPEVLARLQDAPEDGDYLDAVIKETLRLRPVLPIVVRKVHEPFEVGGWRLPVGSTIAPCIYLIHRDPRIYPDPLSFRPERFLDRPAGTYTWLPFGGGVRRCIGASFALFEMKEVLRTLLPLWDLSAAGAPERIVRRTITYVPQHGARILATPR